MNAEDWIESYVAEVAARLPRKQRADVAFELRALLREGLRARAEASGRAVDAALAAELLATFGRPAEVAARYRPTLTIVDPEDGRTFFRAAVSGLAIVWLVGLWRDVALPVGAGQDFLVALGHWWVSTLLASLWWPGFLVVAFGLTSWARRRFPSSAQWTPRSGDRGPTSRAAMVLAIVAVVCGVLALVDPRGLLDLFTRGRLAPSVYDLFAYSGDFLALRGPLLFGLLALNVPLLAAVVAKGRWTPRLRRLELALALATCAAMTWAAVAGPVFSAPASDRAMRFALLLCTGLTLLLYAYRAYRSVRPSPDLETVSR